MYGPPSKNKSAPTKNSQFSSIEILTTSLQANEVTTSSSGTPLTTISKAQVEVFPAASEAMYENELIPIPNSEPESRDVSGPKTLAG